MALAPILDRHALSAAVQTVCLSPQVERSYGNVYRCQKKDDSWQEEIMTDQVVASLSKKMGFSDADMQMASEAAKPNIPFDVGSYAIFKTIVSSIAAGCVSASLYFSHVYRQYSLNLHVWSRHVARPSL
jgi:hypothetical protein